MAAMRRLIASSLGLGLILGRLRGSDAGSGTIGALAAIPIALALDTVWQIAALVVLLGAGWWAAAPFAEGDPGWVVIDETAGALLAMIGLSGFPLAAAWVVARVGDITKRYPGVARAEELPGAIGLMGDDLVAGAYGLAAGALLMAVI